MTKKQNTKKLTAIGISYKGKKTTILIPPIKSPFDEAQAIAAQFNKKQNQ